MERRSLVPRTTAKPGLTRHHSFDYEAMRFMAEKEAEKEAEQESELMNKVEKVHVEYLPIYILGNLCLGTSKIPVSIGFAALMKTVLPQPDGL